MIVSFLGYTHHQGSFLALTPGGDVVVHHGGATEDAVRQGLRRLASPEQTSRRIDNEKQDIIEDTEGDAMIAKGISTKNQKVSSRRVSQRWPTMYSVFRDSASK